MYLQAALNYSACYFVLLSPGRRPVERAVAQNCYKTINKWCIVEKVHFVSSSQKLTLPISGCRKSRGHFKGPNLIFMQSQCRYHSAAAASTASACAASGVRAFRPSPAAGVRACRACASSGPR